MKISIIYDIFKNQTPISNGCPSHLIDFLYDLNTGAKKESSNWSNYLLLPTNGLGLTHMLEMLGHDVINQSINEAITSPVALYVLSPVGGIRNCFGLGPNLPFTDIITDKAKELIRNRSVKFVIDYSHEGWPIDDLYFFQLHKLLMDAKIPVDNVYFLVSNLILEKEYQQWCKKCHIEPINLIIAPFFEFLTFNNFRNIINDNNRFQQLQSIKRKTRSKKFLCYNRRPHGHRHALMCLLSKENLLNDFLVSWPSPINNSNEEDFTWHNFSHIYSADHSLYNSLMVISESLKKTTPWVLDQENFSINFAYGYDYPHHYESSYFSVVTETIFYRSTVFFSEKIWKPIANFHPFLLVATTGSLSKLRELGYKTFSPYINEEYDLIENDGDRLLAIVKEIKRLSNMSESDLNNMYYNDILPVVTHNRDAFFSNQKHHISTPLEKLLT